MPVRPSEQTQQPAAKGHYHDIVDLSFLPSSILERIDTIFNGYFNLGMKRSTADMSSETPAFFPSKLASLNSQELGNKLGEYRAWASYAGDKLKYLAVSGNYLSSLMKAAEDEVLGQLHDSKGNIEAKRAKARTDPKYVSYLSYYHRIDGMRTMLENEMNNYEGCIATLSREISRREHTAGY